MQNCDNIFLSIIYKLRSCSPILHDKGENTFRVFNFSKERRDN